MPGLWITRNSHQPLQPPYVFHASPCQGNYRHPQKGHQPTPTVLTVQYICPRRVTRGQTHWHRNVQEGGRAKFMPSCHKRLLGGSRNRVLVTGPPYV